MATVTLQQNIKLETVGSAYGIRAKDQAAVASPTNFLYIGGFPFPAELDGDDVTPLFATTGEETAECFMGGIPVLIYRVAGGWAFAKQTTQVTAVTTQLVFHGYPVTVNMDASGSYFIAISEVA